VPLILDSTCLVTPVFPNPD
jgi:hypothetical protein